MTEGRKMVMVISQAAVILLQGGRSDDIFGTHSPGGCFGRLCTVQSDPDILLCLFTSPACNGSHSGQIDVHVSCLKVLFGCRTYCLGKYWKGDSHSVKNKLRF